MENFYLHQEKVNNKIKKNIHSFLTNIKTDNSL